MSDADTKRRLVLRVNELFHNLEESGYDDVHPEIFQRERSRWQSILSRFMTPLPAHPLTVVDIGIGTGFVSEMVLPLLRAEDTLIGADISAKMLEVAKGKLENMHSPATLRFLKMQDETIDLPDASADVVTMNSVLHHLPDPNRALAEIERILKPGGLFFLGHEPSNRFFQSRFLFGQARLLHKLAPKRLAAALLRSLGMYQRVVKVKDDPLLAKINETLLQEHLIDTPLDRHALSALIDVHSPTAGGYREGEGFDPVSLLPSHAFRMKQLATYNHILKLSGKRFLAPYESLLRTLMPKSGATFFLVAEKLYGKAL